MARRRIRHSYVYQSKHKDKKVLNFLLRTGLGIITVVSVFFLIGNIINYFNISKENAKTMRALKEKNAVLTELTGSRSGIMNQAWIEKEARLELGMLKPGETEYRLKK